MVSSGGVINYDETREFVTRCKDGTSYFKKEQQQFTNCSILSGTTGGDMLCTDPPCDYFSNSCNWQFYPSKEEPILAPGHKYMMQMCRPCPSYDCNGKYAHTNDKECGDGGVWMTTTNGRTWYCKNQYCKGEMKERSDKKGYYDCKDDKCWGTGKLGELYKCKDPTCVAAGGYMEWVGDNMYNGKWNCNNYKCGGNADGRMTQKSTGWECESPSCPGKMVRQSDDYWTCVDPNCKGRITQTYGQTDRHYFCEEDTNPMIYLGGGLVVVAIVVVVVMKSKGKKLEQDLKKPLGNSFSGIYQAPQNYPTQQNFQYPQNYPPQQHFQPQNYPPQQNFQNFQ